MKKIRNLLIGTAFSLLLFCSLAALAAAAPVWGEVFSIEQPDGTPVDVRIYGDEYYRWIESMDGYTLVEDTRTGYICYALLNSDRSDFVSTGMIYSGGVLSPSMQPPVMTKGLRLSGEHILEKVHEAREAMGVSATNDSAEHSVDAPTRAALSGAPDTIVGITIVIDFQDETFTTTTTLDDIWNYLNEEGYDGFGNNGSVYDYFSDVSGGIVEYLDFPHFFVGAQKAMISYPLEQQTMNRQQ